MVIPQGDEGSRTNGHGIRTQGNGFGNVSTVTNTTRINQRDFAAFAKVIKANGRKVVECPLVNNDGRYEMDFDAYDA